MRNLLLGLFIEFATLAFAAVASVVIDAFLLTSTLAGKVIRTRNTSSANREEWGP